MPPSCSLAPPAGMRTEWEAFLALTPLFSEAPLSVPIYDKLLHAAQRRENECLTRYGLLLEAGLTFFEHLLDVDLALMRLIRENHLEPVRERPFTFWIR